MRRRNLVLAVLVLPAALLVIWGISAARDAAPNPVRVIVGQDPEEKLISPVVIEGAAPDSIEVVVSRARPIPMTTVEMPVGGGPPGMSMESSDPDALDAEKQALRTALDAWLAEPGRALRIDTTWTVQQFHGGLLDGLIGRRPQECRVFLHARLRPSDAR